MRRRSEREAVAPRLPPARGAGGGGCNRTRTDRGRWRAVLWVVAVAAASSAFVVHLALRAEVIRLGYRVSAERATEARLLERERELLLEAATLRAPQRVEAIARDRLEMDVPSFDRIVPVGAGRGPRLASGRWR